MNGEDKYYFNIRSESFVKYITRIDKVQHYYKFFILTEDIQGKNFIILKTDSYAEFKSRLNLMGLNKIYNTKTVRSKRDGRIATFCGYIR